MQIFKEKIYCCAGILALLVAVFTYFLVSGDARPEFPTLVSSTGVNTCRHEVKTTWYNYLEHDHTHSANQK